MRDQEGVGEDAAARQASKGPRGRFGREVVMSLYLGDHVIERVRFVLSYPRRLVRAAVVGEPVQVGHDDDHGLGLPGTDPVVRDVGRVTCGGPVNLVPVMAVAEVERRVRCRPLGVVARRRVDQEGFVSRRPLPAEDGRRRPLANCGRGWAPAASSSLF